LGNRIVRWREDDNVGTDRTIVLGGLPGAIYHDGCALNFGPDGLVLHLHLATQLGQLRAITLGPEGYLYLATSNRDTCATPQPGDDRIVRFTLRESP
jgi:hypothetical protein